MKAKHLISSAERRLNRVCDHMQEIHLKIQDLRIRHQRARRRQKTAMVQQMSLQLSVLQKTYSVYHSAAERITEKVQQLVHMEMRSHL